MDPQIFFRCYMYRIGPIPGPRRAPFEEWLKGLNKLNPDLPKGSRFAHIYRVSIGSNLFHYYIHFEFENFSQLDGLIKNSGVLQKFHKELAEFFGDGTTAENWVLTRLA